MSFCKTSREVTVICPFFFFFLSYLVGFSAGSENLNVLSV